MNLEPRKPQQDVVFRRIRGRIIAIRRKPNKEVAGGAAYIAGGAALAAGSGVVAANLVEKAAAKRVAAKFDFNRVYRAYKGMGKAAQTSFGFMRQGAGSRFSGASGEAAKAAIGTRRSAFRLFKARNLALVAGTWVGGALISQGLNKLEKGLGDKKLTDRENVTNDLLGGGAGLAATAFYYKRLGVPNLGKLAMFTRAKTKDFARPFNLPIKFKKGGPFGKGGTFKMRG
jgi:hypothetical protein